MPMGVRGVALLNGKIYAVLHETSSIHVLNADSSEITNDVIDVNDGSEKLLWPSDIVADRGRAFLYVSDRRPAYVDGKGSPGLFTVKPFVSGNGTVSYYFSLDGDTPAGMSLTADGRLLVACEHKGNTGRSLRLYNADIDGRLTVDRTIELNTMKKYLLQPVKVDERRFVVSQINKSLNVHRVCMIDDEGRERARSHGGNRSSCWPSIRSPWGVMVDPLDSGRLVVVNCHEARIVLLDYNLNVVRSLVSQENCVGLEFKCPRCICYDEDTGLLYVGRRWKQGSRQPGAITVFRVARISDLVHGDQ
jgi:hypothetical protein